jgi:[acyl-carrier-protein] S-malonyltransferase
MLAFTFPGQGSHTRPGMGRPWADHDSWELVEGYRGLAGRRARRRPPAARRRCRRAARHPQRAAHHVRLQPDRARRRRAPGRRAQLLRRPQPRRVHRTHRHRRARLRRRRAPGVRARRRDARGRHDNPGTMAAVLGLDDDLVEVACRRADSDVWVANFNAPGQVVIAGSPEGVAAASVHAKELGAKKVMPLQVSGAFHTPFMAPARDRLRKAIAEAVPRDTEVPVISNVDSLAHDLGDDWSSACCPHSSAAPCAGSTACSPWPGSGVTDFVELGPGGVLTGMAKRTVDGARTISVATPDDLDKLLEFVGTARRAPATQHEGEHLFAVERLVVSPAAGVFEPVAGLGDGSSHRRRHRARPHRRHRGAVAVRRGAAELHRGVRRAGHAAPAHRLAEDGLTHARHSAQRPWRRHHRLGHRAAAEGAHQPRPRGMFETSTTGSSSAPASTSATSAAPP